MNEDGECADSQLTGWELPALEEKYPNAIIPALEEKYLRELQLHCWLLSNIQHAKLDLLIIITRDSKY